MININYKVLIVEDEFLASEYLKSILEKIGFHNYIITDNADDAKDIIMKNKINLIFLDININGNEDGISLAKTIDNIPIIFTTAFIDTSTMDEASQSNSYGYIIKPFNFEDVYSTLVVAFRLLSKKNYLSRNIIDINGYIYNKKTKTLKSDENIINLTKKEIEILNLFCLNINQNISYEQIIISIWEDKNISSSTLRDTVSRLKKKLPNLNIHNIQSYGYVLKDDNYLV